MLLAARSLLSRDASRGTLSFQVTGKRFGSITAPAEDALQCKGAGLWFWNSASRGAIFRDSFAAEERDARQNCTGSDPCRCVYVSHRQRAVFVPFARRPSLMRDARGPAPSSGACWITITSHIARSADTSQTHWSTRHTRAAHRHWRPLPLSDAHSPRPRSPLSLCTRSLALTACAAPPSQRPPRRRVDCAAPSFGASRS